MSNLPDVDVVSESRIPSRGAIDNIVVVTEDIVRIDGWVLPFDLGTPTGLEVALGGELIRPMESVLGIDSPDIVESFPTLTDVDKARFATGVRLTREQLEALDRTLIGVTPVFRETKGTTFFGALNSASRFADAAMMKVVGGDPYSSFEFFSYCTQLAGLAPEHRLLDVGCGCGRMAIPMTYYLTPPGSYHGFDISKDGIQWAQKSITPRYPHFQFEAVDVMNRAYNPEGKALPTEFVFPHEEDTFDFAILSSVFTHMVAEEVRHYLDELHRTIKPGATVLCTCFIVTEETKGLEAQGTPSQVVLKHKIDDYFTSDLDLPEWAIGFRDELLFGWIQNAGFSITAQYPGLWCGRSSFTSYQDLLVLKNEA